VLFGHDTMSRLPDPLLIGDWLADPRDDSLSRGSERVKVEPRTMRLLMRLALTPGEVVSQDELLESVWSGVVVGPASVYQSMSQLRKVLGDTDDPPRYIETVARKGYRLVAKVSPPGSSALAMRPLAGVPGTSAAAVAPVKGEPGRRRFGWRRWVLAAVAVAAATMAWWQLYPHRPPLPQKASIVVLPFTDLTDGHTQQMFCDGLTEETSNWLAQVPSLRVVARSTAFAYRERKQDVRAIGRELQISHVLEGSLRRSGNRMRITVQLIDTNTGYNLWSESYDVDAGDVLTVQEDVARKVAGNLELRITPETNTRLDGRRSKPGPAQELFFNARAQAQKIDSGANELAITLYRQALRADPDFALAKVYLAQAIGNRRYLNDQRMEDLLPEILPLLAEAEKTAPQLAELYAVRGNVYTNLRRHELAERDLKRAVQINPNSSDATRMLGRYYLVRGEPREALSYYTIAAALDPRDFGPATYRCIALSDMAQFDEADKACAQARLLGSGSPWVYSVSSSLEAARGRLDEALRYSAESLERDNNVMESHAERISWLRRLGLLKEAEAAFRNAVAADAPAAHRSQRLVMLGAALSVQTGGEKSLQDFVREFGLSGVGSPELLFELANAWLSAGDYAQARDCVERAMTSKDFNTEDLDSPWLARTGRSYRFIAALAQRTGGESVAAERHLSQLEALLARMSESGVRTAGVYDLKSQLAALRGRDDEAIAALQRAIDLGWSSTWMAEHDAIYATLRKREDFRGLIAAVHARNARTAAKYQERLQAPAKGD
jgi:TolB-like protein/DNA-binding winged helix-turn-helix (wHTH) protein/tetratricopeptide (TPR) repeat protein